MTSLLQRFAYQHLVNDVSTVHTVIPAIPVIALNAAAGILAAPAVPASIKSANEIKIMEVYSDKILKISQKRVIVCS